MNEKEKAIEILKNFKNNKLEKDKLEVNLKGGFKIGDIYKFTELDSAIEIALNYIDKLQQENQELKNIKNKAIEYIEENSFEDTTGVVLNLKDENYWELWKILKENEIDE